MYALNKSKYMCKNGVNNGAKIGQGCFKIFGLLNEALICAGVLPSIALHA
ncbi:UNVERIFIED_CONTAM: hypothetical protein O8I53_08170 [Campylobacter lari]